VADGNARIEALTARLALLEQRTADEAASIRVELEELQGVRPVITPMPKIPAARPRPAREPVDLSWLTGPRGLALTGGIVTLLGIAFVFALAASRGWIGPAVRCSIGGGVSALLLVAAVLLRRRFGHIVSALAAAGAGIGGLYVTLYAASRGYHLLDAGFVWAGVVLAAGLAVTLALAWNSQLLATLGLVAVVLAPPTVQGKLTPLGLGASLVAAATALGIGQHRRWRLLGGLAYTLALLQSAGFVSDSGRHSFKTELGSFTVDWPHRGSAALLACLIFALALAGAAAYQRRSDRLDRFAAALASVSLLFALDSLWTLVQSEDGRGTALLAVATAYAVSGAALWAGPRLRSLAELLGAFALVTLALATATFLSNRGLLTAWTLEGLVLTAFAVRLGQRRYQAAGLAYFAAALVHLFVFETPLSHLFSERPNAAEHIGALLLVVAALAVVALLLHGRATVLPRLDLAAAATSGLLGLYAASLAVMEVAERLGGADLHARFQRGETLVSAFWALVALALLSAGLTRRTKELRDGGLALLGLALAKLFLFDLSQLSSLTRAGSFLAVGLALLAGGVLVQRLALRAKLPPTGAAHP
jgi:Predicted membrane protein (DUF2339)